jgi:hypothetical protein
MDRRFDRNGLKGSLVLRRRLLDALSVKTSRDVARRAYSGPRKLALPHFA